MKVAVIGSGISGLACAHYLSADHEVWVYETSRKIGGHAATVDVQLGTRRYAIDTGFTAFNDRAFPAFTTLMEELGVSSKPTAMGFSVRDAQTGLEYSDTNLDTLFAQRRNLLSRSFIGMIRDILRFNRETLADFEAGTLDEADTMGAYLSRNAYGDKFIRHYLAAMGAAIWSVDCAAFLALPVSFVVRFFKIHGLLSLADRPQWRVIEGGSREYLQPLCVRFSERISTDNPVVKVTRHAGRGVTLQMAGGQRSLFDHVIMATHADQALALLEHPSSAEREILGAIPYQTNELVLHTDIRLLPRNTRTWSSWNYTLGESDDRAVVTYNMNILQGIEAPETFCVTRNSTAAINPHMILGQFRYDHPVFSVDGVLAQQRWEEINGVTRTWYCGTYWHHGMHEDGVVSAQRVANALSNREQAVA